MRILVIGSGGREHALVWKLGQSPLADKIFVAPGNGGTELEGVTNTMTAADDIDGLVALSQKEKIDLVVPGPELPLTLGIVDRLRHVGIPAFGPDSFCARLEGSKSFAKQIMTKTGVPTANYTIFNDVEAAKNHIVKFGAPVVIKADGLAAGKGVVVAKNSREALQAVEDIMSARAFGAAGEKVIIEDRLQGEEVSLLCFCDGRHAVPLPSAQDHKAAFDNDQGPNTGGMGAYSPAPLLRSADLEKMADLTVRPVLEELAASGHPFTGILYAGLMLTPDGPCVLEYNTRFGDPECQPLLMRLHGDLAQIMMDCVNGSLDPTSISWSKDTALGVVLAAGGYPHSYSRGLMINGIEEAETFQVVKIFHSGSIIKDHALISSGGRVLCVTALGEDLAKAQATAYAALEKIRMRDGFYRRDIGDKGLRRLATNKEKSCPAR
ncbi:MAG: phosphoribosylamine--glycine ligase [Desulfovibrio sp.]|nr:phosphoribosylamine--glycine ligase [Desulfovibrio sp.]